MFYTVEVYTASEVCSDFSILCSSIKWVTGWANAAQQTWRTVGIRSKFLPLQRRGWCHRRAIMRLSFENVEVFTKGYHFLAANPSGGISSCLLPGTRYTVILRTYSMCLLITGTRTSGGDPKEDGKTYIIIRTTGCQHTPPVYCLR